MLREILLTNKLRRLREARPWSGLQKIGAEWLFLTSLFHDYYQMSQVSTVQGGITGPCDVSWLISLYI